MERRILKKMTYAEPLSRFRELYDSGMNDKQIAVQLGIPVTFVNMERASLSLPPVVSKRAQHVEQKAAMEAAEAMRKQAPPIAKLRASGMPPLDMARGILAIEGRSRTIRQGAFTVHLIDGKNATPIQWIEAANRVLVREGLPVIGRGSWN